MNYGKIYNKLIESRKCLNRHKKYGIYEKHHIIPKCLGGTNNKNNIILLTPREHYVAHRLLYKQYTGKQKALLAYAFFCMCRNNNQQQRNITSREYALAKKYISEAACGENHPSFGKKIWSDEQKKEISKRMTGKNNPRHGKKPWNYGLTKETSIILKTMSEESKKKLETQPHNMLGFKHSEETKAKISKIHSGKPKSQEHKDKLSNALKGQVLSEVTKKKMSLTRKDIPQKTVICPHCQKEGGISAMKRWHFSNCTLTS